MYCERVTNSRRRLMGMEHLIFLRNAYYNKEDKTVYGTHKTGGFYSCINEVRFAIYELARMKIYPENVSFNDTLKHLHNYSDDKDLYPFIYKVNLETLDQLKSEDFESGVLRNQDGYWSNHAEFQKLNFKQIKMVEDIYFSPSDLVLERIKFLEQKYNIDYNNTMAIFNRGTDKHVEVNLAHPNDWVDHINERNNGYRLLIQTDELKNRDIFMSKFDNSFFFEEMIFNNTYVKPTENKIEWSINFESIVRIIASCKYLITHSGNCGLIPVLYRANLKELSQCKDNGQFIIF
jgi:hypothetical protein